MKKSTLTFSGILTLVFSIILLVVAFLLLGTVFGLEFLKSEGMVKFVSMFQLIFIAPICTFLPGVEILNIVLPFLLGLYGLVCLISGVMQLNNRKASIEELTSAKSLNAFVNLLRIIFCLVVVLFIVLAFVNEDIKAQNLEVSNSFSFGYINYVIAVIFLLFGILAFVLPTIGYKKLINSMQNGDANVQNVEQQGEQNYETPVYQDQYYAYNDTQPINPNDLITDQTQQGESFNLIPGRDGIPANITQKGLEDLARLERLHASGAIDERNYLALKQKICSTNLGWFAILMWV